MRSPGLVGWSNILRKFQKRAAKIRLNVYFLYTFVVSPGVCGHLWGRTRLGEDTEKM
jgi:hypothetical protein